MDFNLVVTLEEKGVHALLSLILGIHPYVTFGLISNQTICFTQHYWGGISSDRDELVQYIIWNISLHFQASFGIVTYSSLIIKKNIYRNWNLNLNFVFNYAGSFTRVMIKPNMSSASIMFDYMIYIVTIRAFQKIIK